MEQRVPLIGIFDSGIGGLTVLRELRHTIPQAATVYLGDTARTPYGNKCQETVQSYASECAHFLSRWPLSCLVIACNTASSFALQTLIDQVDVPVIGTILPAVREAARKTRSGRIGVIGTRATVESGVYENSLSRCNSDFEIFSIACPLFVPFVEEGFFEGDLVEQIVEHYLSSLKAQGIDTLILGCTHYPFLKPCLRKFFGEGVAIIECSKAIAHEVETLFSSDDLHFVQTDSSACEYFVTDEAERFGALARRFLNGEPVAAQHVDLQIPLDIPRAISAISS